MVVDDPVEEGKSDIDDRGQKEEEVRPEVEYVIEEVEDEEPAVGVGVEESETYVETETDVDKDIVQEEEPVDVRPPPLLRPLGVPRFRTRGRWGRYVGMSMDAHEDKVEEFE